jgi:RimJ/RimL family protein N-acetyltransferase
VLRPWAATDADDLRAAVRASDDLERQLGGLDLRDREACAQFLAEQLVPATATGRHFAVAVDGHAVGNVSVSHIEHRHSTAWLSYWLAAPVRGRGLATRALATAADWAFAKPRLVRLELGHRVDNPASCAVATRAGFPAEGVERSKLAYGDLRYDVETHARLIDDPRPAVALLPLVLG